MPPTTTNKIPPTAIDAVVDVVNSLDPGSEALAPSAACCGPTTLSLNTRGPEGRVPFPKKFLIQPKIGPVVFPILFPRPPNQPKYPLLPVSVPFPKRVLLHG